MNDDVIASVKGWALLKRGELVVDADDVIPVYATKRKALEERGGIADDFETPVRVRVKVVRVRPRPRPA